MTTALLGKFIFSVCGHIDDFIAIFLHKKKISGRKASLIGQLGMRLRNIRKTCEKFLLYFGTHGHRNRLK